MASFSPLSSLSSSKSGPEDDLSTPIFRAIIAPLKISSGVLLVLMIATDGPPSLVFLVLGLRGVCGYPSLYTYCSSGGGGTSVISDNVELAASPFASAADTPGFPGWGITEKIISMYHCYYSPWNNINFHSIDKKMPSKLSTSQKIKTWASNQLKKKTEQGWYPWTRNTVMRNWSAYASRQQSIFNDNSVILLGCVISWFPCGTGSHTDIWQLCDNQNLDGRATLLLLPQDWIVISHVFRLVSTTFYKQSNF